MNAKTQPEMESFDAAELGAMMREMRENLGHELDAVARDLRIRLVYLEAIESGRLADLPGNAYVSGFLRSYSDFLGLEGEEIVRRFKMAGAEISSQPQLHLPSPVEEGRLPTASILLVAAVIAAGAYGGWYYLSGSGKGPMETVASLPKELSGLVDDAKNQTAPTEVAKTPAAPAAASDTGNTAPQTTDAASTEAPVPAEASETASSDQPAETPADATSENTASTPAPVAATSTTTAAAEAVRTAAVTPAATPSPAPPARRPGTEPEAPGDSAPVQAASRSSSDSDTAPASPQGGVRIVVRATADSYVAVRTSDNQPLFSQLMRRGDSYEVPSGADLVLETGNAGGLQITVGGKRVPALGPIGEIRRNIPMDAEKLLRGIN
ncbi:unnamed protein product [Discosporangium mesarthrocarpum]